MEISAQSIQTVGSQSGPVQSFVAGLKQGDSLTAQVLGRSPSGQTLVALAGKQVQLPLPATFQPGTVLTLTVQQGPNGLQFQITPQGGGGGQTAPSVQQAVPTGAALSQSAAGTSSSASPGASSASVATSGSGLSTVSTATTPSALPAQSAAASGGMQAAVSSAPTQTSSMQPPLVNARTGIPVPAPQGSVAGQTLSAQVLSTPTSNTAIVVLGTQELPVTLSAPTTPGITLPLVVQAGPEGLQLAHAPSSDLFGSASAAAAGGTGQTPSAAMPVLSEAAQLTTANAQALSTAPAATATTSPAAIIAQATLASLGNQNSVTALLSNVLKLGDRMKDLPDAVQRATQRLTQALLPLDDGAPDAEALQRAIARSGVFLESQLVGKSTDPARDGDIKALLMVVRRALGDWLGTDARATMTTGKPPPPPQTGATPRAQTPAPPATLADDAPIKEIGKTLLAETDAALSRLRLHQIASLPDRSETTTAGRETVHLELPVTLGQQPVILNLVISRDGGNDTPDQQDQGWKVQFAINASTIGEVGAEVGLLAGHADVVLSAAEPGTVEALAENIGELSDAFEAAGITPGILRVRRIGKQQSMGLAKTPYAATTSGHYLDRDT